MTDTKFFHPSDRVTVTVLRMGSRNAEFYVHMSERDIKRLQRFAKKKQLRLTAAAAFRWTGPFKILSTSAYGKPKKRASTKPKPAPPIPLTVTRSTRRTTTTRAKSTKKRRLSAYNIFVKKHRLAGKDMKEIGRLWQKRK